LQFHCPLCHRVSHNNPDDARERYCPHCHVFPYDLGAPTTSPDPYARRHGGTTDPWEFTAWCLEKALYEEENGGDWLSSMLSDITRFGGEYASLVPTDPLQWGVLLDKGREHVQRRLDELGVAPPLRVNPYASS
jgi:hypothetical protein